VSLRVLEGLPRTMRRPAGGWAAGEAQERAVRPAHWQTGSSVCGRPQHARQRGEAGAGEAGGVHLSVPAAQVLGLSMALVSRQLASNSGLPMFTHITCLHVCHVSQAPSTHAAWTVCQPLRCTAHSLPSSYCASSWTTRAGLVSALVPCAAPPFCSFCAGLTHQSRCGLVL